MTSRTRGAHKHIKWSEHNIRKGVTSEKELWWRTGRHKVRGFQGHRMTFELPAMSKEAWAERRELWGMQQYLWETLNISRKFSPSCSITPCDISNWSPGKNCKQLSTILFHWQMLSLLNLVPNTFCVLWALHKKSDLAYCELPALTNVPFALVQNLTQLWYHCGTVNSKQLTWMR